MVPTEYYNEHGSVIDQTEWLRKISSPGVIRAFDEIFINIDEYGWRAMPPATLHVSRQMHDGQSLSAVICTRYVGYDLGFGGEGAPLIYETTVKARIQTPNGEVVETIELYRCPCSSSYEADENHLQVMRAFEYPDNYFSFPHPYTNLPDDPPELPEEDSDYPPVVSKKRNGRSLLF